MKKSMIHLAFFGLIFIVFSPIVAVQTSPADSVHFCLPFDYEQWRRNHPRPAAKRLANLNIGEPRTVRMIYFLPNDRPYRADVVQRMKDAIRNIQTFYAEQMQAHGYGNKTFRFETDAQGEPVVHRVDGQYPDSHYLDETFDTVFDEIDQAFDIEANIYLTVIDNRADRIRDISEGKSGAGRAWRANKNAGFALVTGGFSLRTAAHELGHAFGLIHDFSNTSYIMSYGPDLDRLSACSAEFLAVHPYLNSKSSIEEAPPPTTRLISQPAYPVGSERVSVQLGLSDIEGLHQVILLNEGDNGYEVWECRGLAGEKEAVVEFDYDGYSAYGADMWGQIQRLSDKSQHRVRAMAVDTKGNVSEDSFVLKVDDPSKLPRVPRIVQISGIDQQGPPGEQLAYPFIVEVRDQDDNPLSGIQVTFAVLVGQGRLSERFSVEQTTTDVNGRAQSILTLGPNPGLNLVDVTTFGLQGCEPRFFTAIGFKELTLSTVDSDYRMWHLPGGAAVRLGKGRMGESDRSILFSPNGQLLAVTSGIGVWLYDVATSQELALLPTANSIYSLAFSPDGTTLALGFHKGMVELWDVATGTQMITLTGHNNTHWGTSVAFSSDGKILASMSDNEDIKLWNIETGRNIATIGTPEIHHGYLPKSISVSFSPDGKILASGSEDPIVKLWDVATGTQIATLSGHRLRVASVSFSPDGKILASGSRDGTIKLWDVATRTNIATLEGHTSGVRTVSFSPDGTIFASGSAGTIKLWDVATWTNIATLKGHVGRVFSVSFSPDGNMLASGSEDGTARLWNIKTGNATTFYGYANLGQSVSFSPDGNMLASGSEDGAARLWDVETRRNIDRFGFHSWGVQVVSFSPDSTTLATGYLANYVDLWNVETGEKLATFERARPEGQILSLAFSPDGTMLAMGDPGGVALWDVASVFSASAAIGGSVYGDGAKEHYIATSFTDWVHSIAFHPMGMMLASGSDDGTFTLWDASTLEHIATLSPGGGWITSLAFSPDGTILVSGSSGVGTVKLWDVATREQIATLMGHTNGVWAVSFSPDGNMLATGWQDGVVKLWDVATRDQIATLEGHTDQIESLSFAPDGTLASGSEDGTVLLWDMSPYITSSTPPNLTIDFDRDGIVGFADFLLFVVQFGFSEGDEGYNARYDLDGDGTIGFGDFLIFANSFGTEAS